MSDLDSSTAAPVDAPAADAPAPEPSLRDAIDAAFEQASTEDAPAPGRTASQARDEGGRFAKGPAQAAQSLTSTSKPAGEGVTSPAPRPAPVDVSGEPTAAPLKAPGAWKPEARERWAGVDPSIQAEVVRREREFQTHLQQSAGLRDFVSAFESIVKPYEMFIRAENSNPLAAVQNLFQTAAELRVGTPQAKANLVAGLCGLYNIDLQLLDSILAQRAGVGGVNVGAPTGVGGQQPFHDPRVDQFLMQQAMRDQQQAEAQQAAITADAQAFASEHEFFFDVQADMADMIEIAARRGQVLTVQAAYEKACQLNPEVSKIMTSRQSAGSARTTTQAALRAKRAASSVKSESSPHGAIVPANETLRASVEAAFESAGQNRL